MTQERAVGTVKCFDIPIHPAPFNHVPLRIVGDRSVSETMQVRPSAVECGIPPGWVRARGFHGRGRLGPQLAYCHRAILIGHALVKSGFRTFREDLPVWLEKGLVY